METNADLNMT